MAWHEDIRQQDYVPGLLFDETMFNKLIDNLEDLHSFDWRASGGTYLRQLGATGLPYNNASSWYINAPRDNTLAIVLVRFNSNVAAMQSPTMRVTRVLSEDNTPSTSDARTFYVERSMPQYHTNSTVKQIFWTFPVLLAEAGWYEVYISTPTENNSHCQATVIYPIGNALEQDAPYQFTEDQIVKAYQLRTLFDGMKALASPNYALDTGEDRVALSALAGNTSNYDPVHANHYRTFFDWTGRDILVTFQMSFTASASTVICNFGLRIGGVVIPPILQYQPHTSQQMCIGTFKVLTAAYLQGLGVSQGNIEVVLTYNRPNSGSFTPNKFSGDGLYVTEL